jgi:hypothetical protein
MIFKNMTKEKYYDYEMTGCSTCSLGMAGIVDSEDEMYQMPDDYYSDDADEEDELVDAIVDENLEYAYEDDVDAMDDAVYDDDTFAGDDAEDEIDEVSEEILASGVDEEDQELLNMVDMLEIDELDEEEDDYYVL